MATKNRKAPKRSLSVLSKSDACAWKTIFPTVLNQILEMLGLATNSLHLAATAFFATTILFVLTVILAPTYIGWFLFFLTLFALAPGTALYLGAIWVSKRFIEHRKDALPTAKLTLLQRMQSKRVDHQKL